MYARHGVRKSIILSLSMIIIGSALIWQAQRSKAVKNTPATILTFLGAPGSGKGTLADRCVSELDYITLSTGNLCREHIAKGTELGTKLKEYTQKGLLVPDDVIMPMVKGWLNEHIKEGKTIILDGFPRTAGQADLLLQMLKRDFAGHPFRVVEVDVPNDEIIQRLANRLMCENKSCQAIYSAANVAKNNPKCAACGSALIRRVDDKEEVVRERLKVYEATSQKLKDFYMSKGIAIETVSGSKKSPEEVFASFRMIFDTNK